MSKRTILAIDQSYTCSGIVISKNGMILYTAVFKTDKSKNIFDRAWDVATEVTRLIHLYNVDVVAMEGLAFAGKGNATRDLAGLQFVIATQAKFVLGIDCEIYAPGTIKKVATGKGNSPKPMLLDVLPLTVRERFDTMGVKKTTGLLDMVDAYWISRTAEEDYKTKT